VCPVSLVALSVAATLPVLSVLPVQDLHSSEMHAMLPILLGALLVVAPLPALAQSQCVLTTDQTTQLNFGVDAIKSACGR
jgi:hypothetical protein